MKSRAAIAWNLLVRRVWLNCGLAFLMGVSLVRIAVAQEGAADIAISDARESGYGKFYDNNPPVHGWIAFQAWRDLPVSGQYARLRQELEHYIPPDEVVDGLRYYDPCGNGNNWDAQWNNDDNNPGAQGTSLIEGAWEEDEGERLLGIISIRAQHHFWDPDEEYDSSFPDFTALNTTYRPRSALEQAHLNWDNALTQYRDGNTTEAYYWLGRTAHLLTDMSVPSHAIIDTHAGTFFLPLAPLVVDLGGDDAYEKRTRITYRTITSAMPGAAIPDMGLLPAYPKSIPAGYSINLTKLFYNLAEKADDFDSDEGGVTDWIEAYYVERGRRNYIVPRVTMEVEVGEAGGGYIRWAETRLIPTGRSRARSSDNTYPGNGG